ncbi:MAG: phosphoribosylformimino-5-aminoimidazole carboxamide ribotide isomerase [Deltaproteobacteria bacterium]|nr:phosphoribosylformimino-5-aminoimidazole carboxamide ribotide isomerase [Deltaproteobacteria bacterium]
MTCFRPCIDLHDGRVKQIVGGSLRDTGPGPETNFIAEQGSAYFAELYRRDGLSGGHVIRLGTGNDQAAREALAAWPGGLQLGGGINAENAEDWLAAGAEKVIVTSWLFEGGELSLSRAKALSRRIGSDRLVIDLSCRREDGEWWVATDRWQTVTRTRVDRETLHQLSDFCAEFLIHAADVEGRQEGIDEALVERIGSESPLPCTYAGGGRELADLGRVEALSGGRVDLTFGSALDLFGGDGVRYEDCVAWNTSRLG